MLFSERLINARKEKNMTQGQLAQLCGITLRTVQYYESGKRMPNSIEIATVLADKLGISTQYLLGEKDDVNENIVDIPLVGTIACGPLNFAEENIEARYPFPKDLFGSGNYFMLRAHGDSMVEAGIEEGDLVILREQKTAKDGDIAAVLVNDETTLKRYYRDEGAKRIRLHPENKTMCDIYVKDCVIQGVAVKVLKDV